VVVHRLGAGDRVPGLTEGPGGRVDSRKRHQHLGFGPRLAVRQLGGQRLRTGEGLAALRAAVAQLSPAGQLQVTVALGMLQVLEGHLGGLRRRLTGAARRLAGARELHDRLYGVGPVTGLALTCWLGGAGRFSSARKAVRFTGLDVTVWPSDRKGPPGRLSRQGPEVLRWCVYEAGKTHARRCAPTTPNYAQVKERIDGKRAAISEARKIIRQAAHILGELGDGALTMDPRLSR
jgi:transposase